MKNPATGHKFGKMAEHYANHRNDEHFQEIADTVGVVFGNVIEFPK
jgi:hypothetical protein